MRVFWRDSNLSYISGRRMSPVEGVGVAAGVGVSVGPGVAVASGVFVGSGVAVVSGVFIGSGVAVASGVFVGSGVAVASGVSVDSDVAFALDCVVESSDDVSLISHVSSTVIDCSLDTFNGPQAVPKETHVRINRITLSFFIVFPVQ